MRIYTFTQGDGDHHAVVPEIPGAWASATTREAAVERGRELVRAELAAYERLGTPLSPTPGEQVVEWETPVGFPAFAEELAPATRDHVARAIARLRDVEAEMGAFLAGLAPDRWDVRPGTAGACG